MSARTLPIFESALQPPKARTVATHCPYCSLQCGMNLLVDDHQNVAVEARDFPTNRGGLCQKGWTAAALLRHPDRLTTPLLRDAKHLPLRPAGWDEALSRITAAICASQNRFGLDSVGVFGGGGLTNEKAYLLGKFARVALRTSQIDYNGRFCMSSAGAASIKAFGVDRGLPFPLADLPNTQTVLMVGSNAAETMPPVMQHFQAQRQNGGKLIVVDPRRTPTAAAATLHLQPTPGTDSALANGLLHLAIRHRYLDESFIADRTSGFEQVRRVAATYWPARVERITGIPEAQLETAVHILGQSSTLITLSGRGPEQQSKGVENVLAFINLALALGQAGRLYAGYGCLTGQGNGQGGREHGQKADQLPGYRKIDNLQHRQHVAAVWNVPEASLPGPGRSAYEMLDTLGTVNGVRTLLVFGSNLSVSSPRAGHIDQRLRELDFLMVSDIFLSDTAQLADVVLPCTQWAEEEGTMTNLEGRVIRRQRAVPPPANVRSDLKILADLAELLHSPALLPSDPRLAFAELRRASAGGVADYSGIDYNSLSEREGIFWPATVASPNGTPRLFFDRFGTPDGRARFHPVEFRPCAEEPDAEYPLYLTTGRVMAHYQSGNQTMRVESLRKAVPECFVEIHPAIATSHGIFEGDNVVVSTRRGSCSARARLTNTIRMDTIFVPFHFAARGRANLLTNPALDPTSRMPEFKVCAARIAKSSTETDPQC